MKSTLCATSLLLIASMTLANNVLAADQSRPCFEVNIQNNKENRSNVEQHCDRNTNRTVQAGKNNSAHTVQSGDTNNNKVRQYQYDKDKHLKKLRVKK